VKYAQSKSDEIRARLVGDRYTPTKDLVLAFARVISIVPKISQEVSNALFYTTFEKMPQSWGKSKNKGKYLNTVGDCKRRSKP
jgi:hypothetical protein